MVTAAKPTQTSSILLIEWDEDCNEALAEMLRTAGYVVHSVSGGEAALDDYTACQPDLVLLDMGSPGIDGIGICHRLHAQHGDGCAPIMLMNGGSYLVDEPKRFPSGVVDFLSEPFDSREALAHIRSHLAARRRSIRQQAIIAKLSEVSAARGNLLSMCAHDLRNPLASVSGLAEFLLDPSIGSLNPEQVELVESIREANQNMLKLVNQLFDVSIVEAGKLRLKLAPASLRDSVERAIFLAAVTAARKRTRIVLQHEPSVDPVLMIDVTRIREVVDNLISNAVKYSPPGSCIQVMIELLPATSEAEPSVRFSVRDQGPGIPAAERDLLFRDFSRLSACPTGGERSTGLGLAICRKIIDLHGGRISAVNHPDGGCVFSFNLPLSPCN